MECFESLRDFKILEAKVTAIENYLQTCNVDLVEYAEELATAGATSQSVVQISHDITENGTIYIYHHMCGSPLLKTFQANHFAYLEPIPNPNFRLGIDTIREIIN